MRLCGLLIIGFLLLCSPVLANYEYSYDAYCKKAYKEYLSLHLDDGNQAIQQAIRSNPGNLMATYVGDYGDCLLLLFNGDRTDLEQRRGHMDERIKLLDKGDKKSPWYRLCKAGVYLRWAIVYIRFGENFRAAANIKRSFALLRENKKEHPQFDYNNVFMGLEEAVIGTLPDDFKWIAALFGMKGELKTGIQKLVSFTNNHDADDLLYGETVLYSNYLRFFLLYQRKEVWEYVNSSRFDINDNLLHLFFRANLALNSRKADVALQTMRAASQDRAYKTFPILEYELASAYFLKLDPACMEHFKKFLSDTRGRLFIKESLQKIAYMHYMLNDMRSANYYREQIKTRGSLMVDADKQAQRFAESSVWPNVLLLQARWYTDGGYYTEAMKKLNSLAVSGLSEVELVEYHFRIARVNDELHNDAKALYHYARALQMGKEKKEHYAARAALQMGFIYEDRGDKKNAADMFKKCLSMKGHDFQNSIDQQAKAGINRLAY